MHRANINGMLDDAITKSRKRSYRNDTTVRVYIWVCVCACVCMETRQPQAPNTHDSDL